MRRASIALVLLFLGIAAPAQAKTLSVSPSGSDSAACTAAAPCKSLGRAYAAAVAGDVVQLADGTYPSQTVPSGSKSVMFRGGSNVSLRQMINDASNVTYDGVNVDAGGTKTNMAAFELGGSNVTVKNAHIGNVVDEKAMLASGANLTVDNVDFHDAVYKTNGVHMECLYAIGVPGFTLRNSSFRDCAVMDVLFTYGSWWSPKPPAYGNVTIENNVFAHPEQANNTGWHYYAVYVGDTGPNGAAGDPLNNWVVRNNTFESPMLISSSGGSNGTRFVGNVGSWDCKSGITYRYNVGRACSSQDKAASSFGWVNAAAYDFRLTSSSPAINAGDPGDAPATDHAGNARNGAPDAGAFEYGGTAPAPNPTPTPTPEPPAPTPTPTPTPPPAPAPDTQAPSVPQGMAWTTIGQTSIGLRWNTASDNVAVTGYRIYRNGTLAGTTASTSYTVSGLTCGTSYTIALTAVDAAGNESHAAAATGTTITAACSVPTPPATTGLVGAWGFNEASGSTVADASGKGNLGSINGATRTTTGKFGRGVSFDGVNDFVTIADSASLDLARGMTIEAWVNPTSTSGSRTAVFKENRAAGHQSYSLYATASSSKPAAEVATGGSYTTLNSSQTIPANTWTHVAASFDGTTLRIYRNGVQVGSRALSGSLVSTGDPLKIGGNAVWSEWFKGQIDEVRVWNVARTASQVAADMNAAI